MDPVAKQEQGEALPPAPPQERTDLNGLRPERPLIKETVPRDNGQSVVILRNDHYGSSMEVFAAMFNEAKADFPDLQPKEAEFKQYAGRSYKRTFGLEFKRPTDQVPSTYAKRSEVELTL